MKCSSTPVLLDIFNWWNGTFSDLCCGYFSDFDA